MTEDDIKALCKIRDKYCQWGEVAIMDKAIRLIQAHYEVTTTKNDPVKPGERR